MDLKKVYDSVPRKALWCVLEKFGVPPTMVSVIRSFDKDKTAVVRVGNDLTEDIEVTNGLRQGCTLAPTLFNLYFSAVMACWRARCPQAGVTVRYRIMRKLVGDRTAKSRLLEINMTKSQFADDVAVLCSHQGGTGTDGCKVCQHCSKLGPHSEPGENQTAHTGEAAEARGKPARTA